MCKPAPQTPGAGTTNKSYFMCFEIFTFVNALHFSWGDDKHDVVITVLIGVQTIFCCPKVVNKPILLIPPGILTPTWWTYGVVRSGHWFASTLISLSLFFGWESAVKFQRNSVFWLLITMLTYEACFVLCQDVCWFRSVILKSKLYSGVFDLWHHVMLFTVRPFYNSESHETCQAFQNKLKSKKVIISL